MGNTDGRRKNDRQKASRPRMFSPLYPGESADLPDDPSLITGCGSPRTLVRQPICRPDASERAPTE